MGKQTYYLNNADRKKLEITWKGKVLGVFKKDFIIRFNGQIIDTIPQQIDLEKGKVYTLPDDSMIQIALNPNDLEVTHNNTLLEPYINTASLLRTSCITLSSFGALFIIFEVENVVRGSILWPEAIRLLLGVSIIILGTIAYKTKSIFALWIALILFVSEMFISDIFVPVAIENQAISFSDILGSLLITIILSYTIKTTSKAQKQPVLKTTLPTNLQRTL